MVRAALLILLQSIYEGHFGLVTHHSLDLLTVAKTKRKNHPNIPKHSCPIKNGPNKSQIASPSLESDTTVVLTGHEAHVHGFKPYF